MDGPERDLGLRPFRGALSRPVSCPFMTTGGAGALRQYQLSHLQSIEAQSVHVMREVAAEFERPVLLFSGGKDSIVMLRLAEKAFWPARLPFPVMHVDTGHNFPEVLEFRDRRLEELGARLVVASVQDSIDNGRVTEQPGNPSRNRLQTRTLLDTITENKFDAVFGGHGATRKRRAKGKGLLVPGRVRSMGPEEPASRAVGSVQRATPPRRAHQGLPVV